MDSINKEINHEVDYLGLKNLDDGQKVKLFNIINNYSLICFFLKNKLGLTFAEKNLNLVIGILATRDENVDWGAKIGYYFWGNNLDLRNDFLEEFDWRKLDVIDKSIEKQLNDIEKISVVSWWVKLYVLIRTVDFTKLIFGFAKWFLVGFVLASILYVLVATGWGRDLSWKLLDLYGVVVKMLMVLLLVVAVIVIVVMVSFMYLERKSIKK